MSKETVGTVDIAAASRGGSAGMISIGRVLSGLASAFFVMDAVMKLIQPQFVIDSTRGIGWPADPVTLTILGCLLLISTALYLFRRTSVLGAILLTGYLGGAVASHARIGSPLFTHDLFGVYLGLFVWGGLWLRDPRIRALIPVSR
jgi:DoxX-like family